MKKLLSIVTISLTIMSLLSTFALEAMAYDSATATYTWDTTVPNYNPAAVIHQGTIDLTYMVMGDFLGVSSTQPNAPGYGDSGLIVGWDDSWTGNVGDPNTNGDQLDGLWAQIICPKEGWWDLGFETDRVVVFLSQDHGPYLGEGLETRLYGSNTLWGTVSTQAVLTDVYLDGWRPHNAAEDKNGNGWCSDDIAGVYELPDEYRYVKIAAWSSCSTFNEPEVDAIGAWLKPPVADFTYLPPWPQVCETVTFDASSSTPDGGSIVSYKWDFDDGNITTISNPAIIHHYTTLGSYNVTLTVTDSEGLSDTAWQLVNVREHPHAHFTYAPLDPGTNETIFFDASASTPNGGTIKSYKWDFDDGNITDTPNPTITHHYTSHGVYNVTLLVSDTEDKNDTAWQLVTVTTHDVAVVNVTPESDWLYHGKFCRANINVTVCNQGDVPESFNVTLYYNITAGQIIGIQTVTGLPAGNCITLTFLWNTTEVAMCHSYNITAYATPVPHETDTADNTMTSPIKVKVRLLADVNDDGKVDMQDIGIAARAFGEWPGRPRWLPWGPYADINNDDFINLRDIAMIARNFGKTCP